MTLTKNSTPQRSRPRLSEAKRAAILRDLRCPIMSSGSDEEIAEDHNVHPRWVRILRGQQEIASLAREIADELAWTACTPGDLLGWLLNVYLTRLTIDQRHVAPMDRDPFGPFNFGPTKPSGGTDA